MNDKDVTSCLFAIFSALFLLVTGSILRGFVLMKMWGWFIVPVFALPRLSIPVAIGLSAVVSFLTYEHAVKDEYDSMSQWLAGAIAKVIVSPLLTLAIAWVVTFYL